MTESEAVSELGCLAGWGTLQGPLEAAAGGLMHRVYRARTPRGDFAVKILNPTVATYDGVRVNFRRSERAASAVAVAGLPAVAAVEIGGETVHDVGEWILLAYPWVKGRSHSPSTADPRTGVVVGRLIGQIHGLDLTALFPPEPRTTPRSESNWRALAEAAELEGLAWGGSITRRPLGSLRMGAARQRGTRWSLGAACRRAS